MKLGALVVAAGLLWPVSGFSGGFASGNKIFADCSAPNSSAQRSICLGYIAGMADALEIAKLWCPPEGVTVGQTVDIVMKYLREHPEERHLTASGEGGLALAIAFPCK